MVLSAMPWCSLLLHGLLVFGQADKTPASPTRNALALWQEGQEAMKRGEIPKALTLYQESRKLDPGPGFDWAWLRQATRWPEQRFPLATAAEQNLAVSGTDPGKTGAQGPDSDAAMQ